MKDSLSKSIKSNETGIVNLDNSKWTGYSLGVYKKLGKIVYYFDSFGNLQPPKELQDYFRPATKILYNYERRQPENTSICGHLCLVFKRLVGIDTGVGFPTIGFCLACWLHAKPYLTQRLEHLSPCFPPFLKI